MSKINSILEEICKKGSKYDQALERLIYPNLSIKEAVLSEIALYWLDSPNKVIDIYEKNELIYYFVTAVRYQVHSNNSRYHKRNRVSNKLVQFDTERYENKLEDSYDAIEDKIIFDERINEIDNLIKGNDIKFTWFETEMFKEYYVSDKTFRQIEQDYGIDHCSVWKTVNSVRNRLIDHFENKTI